MIKKQLVHFTNCHLAIDEAMRQGKMCIGYQNPLGWVLYSPIDGAPKNTEPEILCLHKKLLPIPLSDSGTEIVMSWVNRLNDKR